MPSIMAWVLLMTIYYIIDTSVAGQLHQSVCGCFPIRYRRSDDDVTVCSSVVRLHTYTGAAMAALGQMGDTDIRCLRRRDILHAC